MSRNAWIRVAATILAGCTVYAPPAEEPAPTYTSSAATTSSSSGDGYYASDRRGGGVPTYAYDAGSYSYPTTTYGGGYGYSDPGYTYESSPSQPVMGTSTVEDEVTDECTYNGIKLWGDVKVVDSFPDLEVKIVDSFPDLNVKVVDSFPDSCGRWKWVDSFPDFTVKFVDSFPDVQIKYVDSFPGLP